MGGIIGLGYGRVSLISYSAFCIKKNKKRRDKRLEIIG